MNPLQAAPEVAANSVAVIVVVILIVTAVLVWTASKGGHR